MRYLVGLATLAGLAGLSSPAKANEACSYDMYMRADTSLASATGSWRALLEHWIDYRRCDDGGLAEGYSDAVVILLAQRWDQFDVFVSLSERNPEFHRWAIRHIDATTSDDDLEKLLRNAARCTGSAKAKISCREIARAATEALKDIGAALQNSDEMEAAHSRLAGAECVRRMVGQRVSRRGRLP